MLFNEENDLLDQLWVEKYRPKSINDVVLNEDQKNFISRCLEKGEIPHLAFSGPPGSGKTTLARIISDALIKNESDIMLMNGSDSTGVDNMRNNVQGFLKSPAYQSNLKLIYIDEFDYISTNAQAILRNMMETYADNGRFIVTCNYWSKISDPVQSRFTMFEMKTMPKEFVLKYVKDILDTEEVKYDDNTVELVVQSLLPDVRKIVNLLQRNTVNNKLKKIDAESISSIEKKIIGQIIQISESIGQGSEQATINRNIPQIMELLNKEVEPDYNQIYQELFFHESLPAWAKIKVNYYMNMHNACAFPTAHFMAMIYDVIQAGLTFFSMFKKN